MSVKDHGKKRRKGATKATGRKKTKFNKLSKYPGFCFGAKEIARRKARLDRQAASHDQNAVLGVL